HFCSTSWRLGWQNSEKPPILLGLLHFRRWSRTGGAPEHAPLLHCSGIYTGAGGAEQQCPLDKNPSRGAWPPRPHLPRPKENVISRALPNTHDFGRECRILSDIR